LKSQKNSITDRRDYVNVSPKEGLVFLHRQRAEEIDSKLAKIADSASYQSLIKLRDKYAAEVSEFPARHQESLDELNQKISLLEEEKADLQSKIQAADDESKEDISPAIENLAQEKNMSTETRRALEGYRAARTARAVPKAPVERHVSKPSTRMASNRERHAPLKSPNPSKRGGTGGSKNGSSGGGSGDDDGDSDSNDSDPPGPGARAHYPSLVTSSPNNKPKYLNRRFPRRCWRVSERRRAA
jgi:hypothetical protein